MAKIKYYYDTETCKYERLRISPTEWVINALSFLLVSLIFSIGLVILYSQFFKSPKETILQRKNKELELYYQLMNKELDEVHEKIAVLEERDDKVYRVIFEAKPIAASARNTPANKYKKLLAKGLDRNDLIAATLEKMEKLKNKIAVQSKSYDEIVKLAKNKQKMMASIPAIQPISNKELTRLASGFGMRIHPIYKVKKMHTGCDFSAPRGTHIYATGDGVIRVLHKNPGGYGNEIEIDHGFGYVTKYAHLESFNVRSGQRVKRGELIGTVGNTGLSTAPHLHYEIIKNGVKVNPVLYFYQDLNPAEYERILQLAAIENQSLS